MALVRSRRVRRRVGLGGILDEIEKLPYANAELFPNVNFAALPPGTTIGDLLASGAITQAEYEAAYGAVPSPDNADYQQQYEQMVSDINAGIAAGYYTADSLDGFTFERWLNQYTPLGSNAGARAGGMVRTADGGVELVDETGAAVQGTYAPPPPPAVTGPARYLVNGIEYLSTGEVISVDGVAVTGKKLTAEQVNRLTSGGALTQAERDALLPPKPVPTSEAVAQSFQDANAGQSATPVQASGGGGVSGPGFAVPANGGGATAPGGVAGLLSSPYLLLVVAAGAYLVMRKRS